MTTGIILPAHMGSTRFPGKPLAIVGGRPLLSYAVEAAKSSGMPWCVATSDETIRDWCAENNVAGWITDQCRNGTERAALLNRDLKWDRVIVLQCDEPDVTGVHLEWFADSLAPATMVSAMAASDWGNPNTVAAEVWGNMVRRFTRSPLHEGRSDHISRHVGVYLYDSNTLAEYLEHPPTQREVSHSLEQLRTMAMGYAFSAKDVHPNRRNDPTPLRSVNVPEDVNQFKEDGHTVSR